jgi:hypothetical protein
VSLIWVALFSTLTCSAQQYSRFEAGIGTDSQTFSNFYGSTFQSIGFADDASTGMVGNVTINLSPSLAVEGSVSFMPQFAKTYWIESGHELTAFGGVKAGKRGRLFGVYGKIEPGLASFSCGLSYYGPSGQPFYDCQRRTHFALNYGAVVEYHWRPRTTIRVDVAQTLLSEFDQVVLREGNSTESLGGHIAQHFDLRFAVEHRFGSLRGTEREPEAQRSAVDVGVIYALQVKEHLTDFIQADQGIGAWISWNVSKHFSWDTSAIDFPRHDRTAGYQDGGTSLEGFTGIKAGVRRGRIGVFAKVRSGAILFSRAIDSESIAGNPPSVHTSWSKFVDPALDTGGVVEAYPTRHFVLRAEGGAASLFYPTKAVSLQGVATTIPSERHASVLFLFGAGWRF